MAWRSIFLSKPARLNVNLNQLSIAHEGQEAIKIPLEDIATVVIESSQISLTAAVLQRLADVGAAVIVCDATHSPHGVLVPFYQHSRATQNIRFQLEQSVPSKKRAWQAIVRQKLINQAFVLGEVHKDKEGYLRELAKKVASGDSENLEAQGARFYFSSIFGSGFSREQNTFVNSALNYGYSIIRSAIARSIATKGLVPALGLHHRSQLNAFNLADDIIEVYRAFVDKRVLELAPPPNDDGLGPDHKAKLLNLLYYDVLMSKGAMTILASIDEVLNSLCRYYEHDDVKLLDLPRF